MSRQKEPRNAPASMRAALGIKGTLRESWQMAAMILGSLALALVMNAFHPMGLPLRLSKSGVKRPGVPTWLWAQIRFTSARRALAEVWQSTNAILVDVRDSKDYDASHAAGAFSLPYRAFEASCTEFADRVPRERRVLLYCYGTDCGLSVRVASRLLQRGYRDVVVVERGFAAWQVAGLPIETVGPVKR